MYANPELFTATYDDCLSDGDLLLIRPKGREHLHGTDGAQDIVVDLGRYRNVSTFFDVRHFGTNPIQRNPLFYGVDVSDPIATAELEIIRNMVPLPEAGDIHPGDRIILPVVGTIMDRCVGLYICQPGVEPDPTIFLMKTYTTSYF